MARKVLRTYDRNSPTHMTEVLRIVVPNYHRLLFNYREKVRTKNTYINNQTTTLVKAFGKKIIGKV
jgi:hypothetical protein